MLGLASKSRRLSLVTENPSEPVGKGKPGWVEAPERGTDGKKKRTNDNTAYYKTEAVFITVDTAALGKAFCKTATACVSITDKGFADDVNKL